MNDDKNIALEHINNSKFFIFDFDGTLVNLVELNVRGFREVFARFDISFTQEDFMKYISGRGSVDGMRHYLADYEIYDYDEKQLNIDFDSTKKMLIENHFEEVITKLPGIVEFLEWSASHGKRAVVATSSLRQYANKVLDHYDMTKYFEKIIDRTDVTHGKPAPDIFNLARRYFGVTESECVIFEDSRFGLQAAKDAGVYTIGILNPGWNDKFVYEMADVVIKDYKELIPA